MIVTFDTAILVRATSRSKGPARKVIEKLASDPAHTIALSSYILSEVSKVLAYPRMQELFALSHQDILDHIHFLESQE